MDYKSVLITIAIIILIPIGAYLRDQTYKSVHGRATMGRDIGSLISRFREWRNRRKYKQKHK